MSDDMTLVSFSWDSGPYGVYFAPESGTVEIEGPNGYGRNTLYVPTELWKRYEAARAELFAAEEALDEAEQRALNELRAKRPALAIDLTLARLDRCT